MTRSETTPISSINRTAEKRDDVANIIIFNLPWNLLLSVSSSCIDRRTNNKRTLYYGRLREDQRRKLDRTRVLREVYFIYMLAII